MRRVFGLLFCYLLLFATLATGQPLPSPSSLGRTAAPASSTASTIKGLVISADESDRDTEADTLDLNGHVQIMFKDQHLSCERARINFRAKTIDASGNVTVLGSKATVSGARVYLDYETNTGVIYTGSVKSENVFFEGELITRTTETDYMVEKARFTTCTNCPESWSFTGQRIRAELGGYAYIKNSFLRFGGWPLLWFPYLIVPLKSDRQSGLLTPEFEQSESGGLTLSESFFWAISKSQDTTLTLKNYELRGLKTLVNYRYMLSENSGGELDFGYLRDRAFAEDPRLNRYRPSENKGEIVNRWFMRYAHYYELPEGYTHRLQLNNVSDLQYSKDFPWETLNHGDTAMENRMSLTKNTVDQHYSVDTSYYVNLLQADPLAGNSDAVHRLPELRFSQALTPLGQSGLLYTTDLNHANFVRSEFGYDDMNQKYLPKGGRHLQAEGSSDLCTSDMWYNDPKCIRSRDGKFDPDKDIIRTGQRLDFKGTLYRPIQAGNFIEVLPRLQYRETQYKFGIGEDLTNTRRFLRADISARSHLSNVFGPTGGGPLNRYKHEVVPELTFTTIPWLSQSKHPFFGNQEETPFFSQQNISDSDINSPYGIQFDYNDRVYDRKLVTFALTNKLTKKSWAGGNPSYLQIVTWKLAQSYDMYQAESDIPRKQPFSDLVSDLRVKLDRLEIYQRLSYYPYQQVNNTSSRIRLLNEFNDFIEFGHLLSYNISPGQETSAETRTEDYTISIRKNFSYLEFLGRATYDINPPQGKEIQRFKSYGYGAQVKLPGDCWYFTITQYRITGGDSNFKVSFDFIWDGQKKPTLPDGMLASFGF